MTKLFDEILDILPHLTNSDDVRWLLCYVGIEAGYRVNIRGIGFHRYRRGPRLIEITGLADDLEEADLVTLYKTLKLVYEGLRPKTDHDRGVVEIKTIKREYPEIDWETKLPLRDKDGNKIMIPFYYSYVYIRLYAGRGDADRRRSKLLSVYADEGMGHGGSGGYVARALEEGLITEDQILDAYHGPSYGAFVDECIALLAAPQSKDAAQDQTQMRPPSEAANKTAKSQRVQDRGAETGDLVPEPKHRPRRRPV